MSQTNCDYIFDITMRSGRFGNHLAGNFALRIVCKKGHVLLLPHLHKHVIIKGSRKSYIIKICLYLIFFCCEYFMNHEIFWKYKFLTTKFSRITKRTISVATLNIRERLQSFGVLCNRFKIHEKVTHVDSQTFIFCF